MLTKKNQQEEQSVQEELTLFPSSPAAFVSHFATPVTAPSSAGAHKAGTHTHAKGRDQSILAADSGFHFGPRAMRFIQSRLHDVLGKPRNFILPESSDFIVVAPWHAASSSDAADRQAYAYAPRSRQPSKASKLGWLTKKIKKKAHLAAMSKKAPACFSKSSGHIFNHPRIEIDFKESVLGVTSNMNAADGVLSNHG